MRGTRHIAKGDLELVAAGSPQGERQCHVLEVTQLSAPAVRRPSRSEFRVRETQIQIMLSSLNSMAEPSP